MKQTNMYNSTNILSTPDHYVGIAVSLDATTHARLVTDIGGRKIIPAGTIYPTNDAQALGVTLYAVDVTDGSQECSLVIHGFIKTGALPVLPTAAAKTALNMIKFFPLMAMPTSLNVISKPQFKAGVASVKLASVQLLGATYRDSATTPASWVVSGANVGKVTVTAVTLSEDKITAFVELTGADTSVAGNVEVKLDTACTSTGMAVEKVEIATVIA